MSCSICFDDDIPLVKCLNNHGCCRECVRRGTDICIAENKEFVCPELGCKSTFSQLQTFLQKEASLKYEDVLFEGQMKTLDINLHSCPFCPNRVILEANEDTAFHCLNGCNRKSCLTCNKDAHEGPCKGIHLKDELETNNLVIKCCGIPFIRGDACNKVACSIPTCPKKYCWICKGDITIEGYNHFERTGCPLWGERAPTNQIHLQPLEPLQPQLLQPLEPLQPQPLQPLRPLQPLQPLQVYRPQQPIYARICLGITKKGILCHSRAKHQGYCGLHVRQIPC